MDFRTSTEYLLSLGNEVSAMKLGLNNIRILLASLGNPQNKYIKVQVAGTNGKGSVCAFLDSICREAGVTTGVFTSPHLASITERVRINGVDMGEGEFARAATLVRETSEALLANDYLDTVPTYFEQVTAIALVAFAEHKVQLAILETGMGGRYDATTAADADVVAITRIDLDHQEYLGDTIEKIAAEKAAIIDDEFDDIVIGTQSEAALKVIKDRCSSIGAVPVNDQVEGWTITSESPETVRVETTLGIFPNVTLGLKGRHQIENAETAIKIVAALRYGGYDCCIEDGDIILGLKNARHSGRLEYVGRYLFDGAHNVGGAKALAEYLDEFETRPITIVLGAMRDKDVSAIATILVPRAENVILTQPENARSMAAEDLAALIPGPYLLTRTVGEALAKADKVASSNSVILVTGSLYLVGEAKRILNN